ncbi:MAG: hypothetical protein SVR08_12195 [Spirochaetota bacterium]|nr:hypothetical protein [Spirochaetota bacterium]
MERINIWYLTDNEDGLRIANSIVELGLNLQLIKKKNLKNIDIPIYNINIFIIDYRDREIDDVVSMIKNDERMHHFLKFFILYKRQINKALKICSNILHIEFLSRPIDKREFALLLEKSVIVERYREMMRYVSREVEERIDAYENIMDINRKDIFVTEKERDAFEKILDYEKHLMSEQMKLNKAIEEISIVRQNEMLYLKKRINAEEMLEDLRRKELMDANSVIQAQENVIDYSSMKLMEATEVIDATERVVELSRNEALQLRKDYAKVIEENKKLTEEVKKLKTKICELKK